MAPVVPPEPCVLTGVAIGVSGNEDREVSYFSVDGHATVDCWLP